MFHFSVFLPNTTQSRMHAQQEIVLSGYIDRSAFPEGSTEVVRRFPLSFASKAQ